MVEWLNSMVFHGGDIVVAIALALSVGFIAGAGFAEWKLCSHDPKTP